NDVWKRVPAHRALDLAVVIGAAVLAVLHTRGWQELAWLGDAVTAGEPEPLWIRESEMPLLPLLTVLFLLRAIWIIVDAAWMPLQRALGWLVLPLGEAALFTFVAHLVAIPVFFNLPGFPFEDASRLTASIWVGAYLLAILGAVHLRRHVLTWLRAGTPSREWVRRHGPAAAVATLTLGLLVAGADPTGQSGPWGVFDGEEFDEFDDDFDVDDDLEFDDEALALLG
ncbi:MAG: hypothetical protein AAGE98_16575, partial [Actinomycetota bacterium]